MRKQEFDALVSSPDLNGTVLQPPSLRPLRPRSHPFMRPSGHSLKPHRWQEWRAVDSMAWRRIIQSIEGELHSEELLLLRWLWLWGSAEVRAQVLNRLSESL